jgi:putative flippase GtrA
METDSRTIGVTLNSRAMKLFREFGSAKFIRFLAVGGFAALVNIGSRALLSRWIPYVPAIVIAYGIGMATAYILFRALVFGKAGHGVRREVLMFVVVNILAVGQVLLVSVVLAWYVLPAIGLSNHAETIAHIVGVSVPAFTSFLGHKYWTFRKHAEP